jgi:hypothetical protein
VRCAVVNVVCTDYLVWGLCVCAVFVMEVTELVRIDPFEENNCISVCRCMVNSVLAAQGENRVCLNE